MGGADKGWIELAGQPLIAHVIERFAPQVDELLISANRNLERYRALGYTVVPDQITGFIGPLAGLHAALASARHDWLASCPCDSPWLPPDLVPRLRAACDAEQALVAVARSGGQAHPVFALMHRDTRTALERYLHAGGRRVGEWYREMASVEVEFDDAHAFRNLNTDADLSH